MPLPPSREGGGGSFDLSMRAALDRLALERRIDGITSSLRLSTHEWSGEGRGGGTQWLSSRPRSHYGELPAGGRWGESYGGGGRYNPVDRLDVAELPYQAVGEV